MPLFLLLALLLPLPLAAAHKLDRRFEEVLPLCFGSYVAVSFFLGVFGLLSFGRWIFWIATAGAVFVLLHAFFKTPTWKDRRTLLGRITGPGFFVFVFGMIFLWWMCRGRQYANWDEYSHWGRALKAMLRDNVFPCIASGKDGFREYPPAPALFQYLGFQASGLSFRPDAAIFLQSVFSLGFLLYPLHWIQKNKYGASIVTAAALFFAPLTVYYNFYTETTVDGLLGVFFAFLLLGWLGGDSSPFEVVLLSLTAFTLSLTKSSGLAFVLMAAAAAAITALVRRRSSALHGKKLALWLLAPLVAGFIGKQSWELFLNHYDVPRRWHPSDLSLQSLADLFRGEPQWRIDTIQYFGWNIFKDHNYGSLIHVPYALLLALLILLGVGLYLLLQKADRRRFGPALWGASICAVLYTVSTLVTYLFWFAQSEAVILASLSRYLNTCLTAILIVLAACVGPILAQRKAAGTAVGAVGCAAVWLLAASPSPMPILTDMAKAPLASARTQNMERPYAESAAVIRALYPADAEELPVFIVSQRDYGLTTLRLDYELAPAHLPEHTSSIGSPYEEGDMWTQPYTPETWSEELIQNYEYVYLYQIDEKFLTEFGSLFNDPKEIQNWTLYKVVPQSDGLVKLELVP